MGSIRSHLPQKEQRTGYRRGVHFRLQLQTNVRSQTHVAGGGMGNHVIRRIEGPQSEDDDNAAWKGKPILFTPNLKSEGHLVHGLQVHACPGHSGLNVLGGDSRGMTYRKGKWVQGCYPEVWSFTGGGGITIRNGSPWRARAVLLGGSPRDRAPVISRVDRTRESHAPDSTKLC